MAEKRMAERWMAEKWGGGKMAVVGPTRWTKQSRSGTRSSPGGSIRALSLDSLLCRKPGGRLFTGSGLPKLRACPHIWPQDASGRRRPLPYDRGEIAGFERKSGVFIWGAGSAD